MLNMHDGYEIVRKENLIMAELKQKMRESNSNRFEFLIRCELSDRIFNSCEILGFKIAEIIRYEFGLNKYVFEKVQ